MNILPATVVVAIVLFLIKEILEQLRKYQGHKRQVDAVKQMLSDEIEKNNYTVGTLRRTLIKIKDEHDKYEITLNMKPSGSLRIEFKEDKESYGPGWPIPNISRTVFDKTYVQLASLDKELFDKAKDAYESLSEAEHVRNSLIDNIEAPHIEGDGFLVSFAEYGIEELVTVYLNLAKLYKECTGRELDKNKLRTFA